MLYAIKFLDEETGTFLPADTTQSYEADSELEALHKFAEVRKEDLLVEDLQIVSEDPFVLRIRGWAEAEDHSKFEIVEGEYEYIAEEEFI